MQRRRRREYRVALVELTPGMLVVLAEGGEGCGGEGRPPAGQGRRCEVRGSVGGEGEERGTQRVGEGSEG